ALNLVVENLVDAHSFTTGLSGRVRARLAPEVYRTWSADTLLHTSEAATLQEIYWMNRGQAVWLALEQAQVQNMLPPPLNVIDRTRGVMYPKGWEGTVSAARTVKTEDAPGGTAASVLTDTDAKSPVIPCQPGKPLAVSAYLDAGEVRIVWVDSSETETAGPTSGEVDAPVGGALNRAYVSVPEVAGQTAFRLVITGATTYARPQATWTDSPVPWVSGKGASSVIFGPPRETPLRVD